MIIIDWEFSGLDPIKNWLLSIWAVDFYNPENQFYWECRLEKYMTYEKEALEINWFSKEEIYSEKKQSIKELITKFDNWLKTCKTPQILIWQNPKTDLDFLRESYKVASLEYTLWHRSLDTHTISFVKHLELNKKIPIEKWNFKINLDYSLDFVWIKWWEPKPHNA